MISKELQKKLDFYEQLYFSLDKPVPFKNGLLIYPALVSQYYDFYGSFPCLTMDKTVKYENNEFGIPTKVPNIKGLSQSYEAYLIDMMEDERVGAQITNQVMQLFELIFHIKKGMYCPKCGHEISYEQLFVGIEDYVKEEKQKAQNIFINVQKQKYAEYNGLILNDSGDFINHSGEKVKPTDISYDSIPGELMNTIVQKAKLKYFKEKSLCPECGSQMRDIFSIRNNNGVKTLMVRDVEINSKDFEELQALIPRQNILDYDGDKYLDPELKEELEIKAKMQNQDYTSPTLEKQLVCVAVGTGYTFEYLETLTMRKLSMLLRTVDRKSTYYAQLQASMSGMVEFKEPPKHWIFSDDKKNIADEFTSLEEFEHKFKDVT